MASWAKVGAKCVCVSNGEGRHTILPTTRPIVGEIYTIRAVVEGDGDSKGQLGVLLEEIQNPISPKFGVEYGFHIYRFRPIITKTQEHDVALFKHHLIESSARTDA